MAVALIVAAGQGVRMGGKVKKQYLALSDRPILSHTLEVFDLCPEIDAIFLTLPPDDADSCLENILNPLAPQKNIHIVSGGAERQDSVYNGLRAIDEIDADGREDGSDIVVIHDGVRPFVTREQIGESVAGAISAGACILGIPASDTLKRVGSAGFIDRTLERDTIWLAQTPQAFRRDLIRKAHDHARQTGYRTTDDASLVENIGHPVSIIPGNRYNLKITRREDLELAEAIIQARSTASHPFSLL